MTISQENASVRRDILDSDAQVSCSLTICYSIPQLSELCPSGFWGDGCTAKCDCGENSECDPLSGQCFCKPGFKKFENDGCKEGCVRGKFGIDCSESCRCENSGVCDEKNGRCKCPPGFVGARCEVECPSDRFGPDCSKKCECQNGSCDKVTGQCLCSPGFKGKNCDESCDSGFFGPGCKVQYSRIYLVSIVIILGEMPL